MQNLEVTDGDIVFVPRMEVFYIYGEVQRPSSYRLQRDMTVMQALSMGGGLTRAAHSAVYRSSDATPVAP